MAREARMLSRARMLGAGAYSGIEGWRAGDATSAAPHSTVSGPVGRPIIILRRYEAARPALP